jgi:hypothetical protein
MVSEMGEYLDFINNLEPAWEDPHEFDWLRSEDKKEEKRTNILELNRFPGLKTAMGY